MQYTGPTNGITDIDSHFYLTKKNRFIHIDLNHLIYYQFKIIMVIKILTVIIA